VENKQAVTSSLQVAEVFEKNHRDVLEAIRTKMHSAEFSVQYQKMFAEGMIHIEIIIMPTHPKIRGSSPKLAAQN